MEKHILILCLLGNPYQKAEGGFHETIYEIIEYFKEQDILFTIITSNTTLSEDCLQQKYFNINFWELALNSDWIEDQNQLYLNAECLINKIQKIITKSQLKISLIHSLHWINGYLAIKINPQKKIFHIHSIISSSFDRNTKGFLPRSNYQRQCEDLTFNAANVLVSITEAEKQQLVDYYHIPSSKILIVGRKADFYYSYFYDIHRTQINKTDKLKYSTVLKSDNNLENQKAFIYVGRIIEYKGIQEIIKAWYILYVKYNDEMPPLWIIGGTEKTIYEFRNIIIEEIPFLPDCERKHKIYWWGYMEHYGISTILQKSHVLLMHSAFEPGGRVILEAMSANKPIIATPEGFAKTYIKDWYNGFQVQYQDINQLSFCMEFFVKNEFLSSMLGINAKNIYTILNNSWKYYETLNALYHLDKIVLTETLPCDQELKSLHPLLIDEFPYSDIKNENSDLVSLCNNKNIIIEEITKYNSYIWKIILENKIYFAKQVYNQLNLQQIWNPFDSQKVYTIWMQYNTAILSTQYSCIISPFLISEKLFTYLLPCYKILAEEKVYKIYFSLLSKLAIYKCGTYKANISYDEQIQYFEKINHTIQRKHKYYTINIYAYELQESLNKNKVLFQTNEISILTNCFEKIKQFLSLRKDIKYGLNYGKSFLTHIIYQRKNDYFLLPSSDIFIGEFGQDEGIIFMSYYFRYHTFLKTSYYSRKTVLIWSLLYCLELFISSKILRKSNIVTLVNLIKICEEINNEK